MTETFDAVVIGAGVVGAATAFHLAKLGGLKVCVVDRGPVCGGGTAKSCAIVRSHYSVPSNTALTLRSLEMFGAFAVVAGGWRGRVRLRQLRLSDRGAGGRFSPTNCAAT